VPRPPSPEVRRSLIEEAAALVARREPVTLRGLASAAGVSTMAIYTYFDGMPGLWGAVRQEGFERLSARLAEVPQHRDPVRHLAALGVAYAESALAAPTLYRLMFDAAVELPDPAAAAASFDQLVAAVDDGKAAGRFSPTADARDVATRFWATGHGLTSLAVGGVLPAAEVVRHAPITAVAVFVDAGDEPARARRSVTAAWRGSSWA
jgi:AcrR family transcriptional regulator